MDRGGVIFHGYGSVTDQALQHILSDHYLQRKPPMQDTFEWRRGERVLAVVTFGVPASRHMQIGACPDNPDLVVELNRLWIADDQPHGTASWLLAQCLSEMPPRIVLSYADTAAGHDGTVYRATNFHYAGWTDMDRKGKGAKSRKVRRKPKARYWTVTGNKRERASLRSACKWPVMCWKAEPVPRVHVQRKVARSAQ